MALPQRVLTDLTENNLELAAVCGGEEPRRNASLPSYEFQKEKVWYVRYNKMHRDIPLAL